MTSYQKFSQALPDTVSDATKAVHAGKDPSQHYGALNTPVYQVSTIKFPTFKALEDILLAPPDEKITYGMHGTPTTYTLEQAICALEGGYRTRLCASGLTAATAPLLCYLSAGDHLLIVDSAYGPTRAFCTSMLSRMGVEITPFDPSIGKNIETLIKPGKTKAIFMESPGSWTFEIQDVPALVKVAKKYDITTILDNTWASPLYFKPFQHGVDVSIQAATKYISGHSDLVLGSVTTTEEAYPKLRAGWQSLGLCSGGQDAFLATRGIRTIETRLKQHWKNALHVAEWMENRPEVYRVLYPALPSNPSYELWKRDFLGANGLFTIALKEEYSSNHCVANFVDHLRFFSMGYSWGGYDSLILPCNALLKRSISSEFLQSFRGKALIRIHIGLENIDDLMEDLEAGLERMHAVA